MLTIHHLGISQSERIVWLCEELELAYELKHYERDPVTRLSPPALVALHPLGAAPVITDGDLVLAKSGAIMEYIIAKHAAAVLPFARPIPILRNTSTGFISPTATCSRTWGATWCFAGSISLQTIPSCSR